MIGVVTGLLTQLDRLRRTEGVILLAATNYPDTVPTPVRPRDPARGPVRPAHPRHAPRPRRRGAALAPCDLDAAAAADLAPAPDPDTVRRVSIHEAGHLLTGHLFGAPAAQRATLKAGGGAVERPKHDFLTRARIDALVRTFLGGRAAEAVAFDVVSSGAGSDLAMATQLLTDAETRLGLGETLTWQSPDITARLLAQGSRTRIEDALRTAEAETRKALACHRDDLERIAEALLEKRELHAADLANLLDQVIPDRTLESADLFDADERTPQTFGT